ncbi:50S ribosomal protein L9 [bacterium]|jgi:large subunit ribosomal protein L9|nr:50S ribosomal protein L9 [bacterium]
MAKRLSANRTIEVIMLQNDKHLGEKYEIVRVKPIFARNVLFPNKIAILADKEAKNNYAQKMEAARVSREKKAASLEDLFSKITADEGIEITRKANKDNTLYAKVDENDIVEKIKEVYGIEVEPHLFKLKKKLNEVGTYSVAFAYNDLKREITVKILGEVDKNAKKEEEKEEVKEVVKTKEEIKAEREAAKAKEKADKIAKLKEKYK